MFAAWLGVWALQEMAGGGATVGAASAAFLCRLAGIGEERVLRVGQEAEGQGRDVRRLGAALPRQLVHFVELYGVDRAGDALCFRLGILCLRFVEE